MDALPRRGNMFDALPDSLLADRYRLISKLGQGGMGAVWRAEDQSLRIEIALKLIDPTLLESSIAMARFQQEAHAAARLRSTHIVHINDYGIDDTSGQPYIAMDLLEGENLQQRLDRAGKLPFTDVLHILSQVARGLHMAHSKGIAHRDLKPENIFLARESGTEIVKLLDFGIAKRLDAFTTHGGLKTGDGQMLGTPYYMSPEQAQAKSSVDHRTDIWAFGIIAYECLTGRRPFESDNLATLVLEICNGEIPNPAEFAAVPVGFPAWFERAVCRDIKARFQAIDVASNELAALLDAPLERIRRHDSSAKTIASAAVVSARSRATIDGSAATPAEPVERTRPVPVRHWLWLGLPLGVLGLGAWYFSSGGDSPRTLVASSEPVAQPAASAPQKLAPNSAPATTPPIPTGSSEFETEASAAASGTGGAQSGTSNSAARTHFQSLQMPRSSAAQALPIRVPRSKQPKPSANTRQGQGPLDPGI